MSEEKSSTLFEPSPFNIGPNPDNPRAVFDEEDLKYLQQSIKEVGVLVPIIVYRNSKPGKKYVLLDGERRLICAKRLKLSLIPANEIDRPSRLQNILLMFNIHNVRKDWEIGPTALKLEVVMRLLPKGKETPASQIAKITGMSAIRVAECKRILSFDKRYMDMTLDPDPSKRIRGDFFSQLALALEKLDNFPEIKNAYSKNKIIDLMIQKYKEGTVVNIINEFRTMRKILASPKKGVEKKLIINNVKAYLNSKPMKDRSGKIIKKAMTMHELFERTSYSVYKEDEIVKKAKELEDSLSKFDFKQAKNINKLINSLEKLANRIDKMLDKI